MTVYRKNEREDAPPTNRRVNRTVMGVVRSLGSHWYRHPRRSMAAAIFGGVGGGFLYGASPYLFDVVVPAFLILLLLVLLWRTR